MAGRKTYLHLISSDTGMRATMHLNSWRAAGKICRKRRPGGKVKINKSVLNSVYCACCPENFSINNVLPVPVFCYPSLRMAVQEDLEEEKREEEEERKRSLKRKKKN